MHLRVPASLALAAASLAPAQQTFVVGPGGFSAIQPAIDAAADGDRILVRAGSYNTAGPQPVVVNKGVTITCEDRTYIGSGVRFTGILPGRQASIANGMLTGGELPGVRTLTVVEVIDCGGVVGVLRCGLYAGATLGAGGRLIYVSDPVVRCHRATLIMSGIYLHGGYGTPVVEAQDATLHVSGCYGALSSSPFILDPQSGQVLHNGAVPPAIRVTDCLVSLSDVYLAGGAGVSAVYTAGGDALQAARGELHMARVICQGGKGFDNPSGPGGAGGNGMVHSARVAGGRAVSLLGGRGGTGVPPGTAGAGVLGPAVPSEALPSLTTDSQVVRAGGRFRLNTTILPGAYLLWMLGLPGSPLPVPGVGGLLVPRFDQPTFLLGPILVASGSAFLESTVPNDPSFVGLNVAAQAAGLHPVTFSAFLSASILLAVGP